MRCNYHHPANSHELMNRWIHDHTFGQDKEKPGEKRTILVIIVTAIMMVVEISTGIVFGSMALLADGLHMASHAAALCISLFAYVYSRKHAGNPKFSFGTGKVNALGGYTGAVLLAIFALMIVYESVHRLIVPTEIAFNQAILVAVVGLIVNGVSVFILGDGDHHHHHHHHDHGGGHSHSHDHDHGHHHHDHNLRAAYLHVLADALTSVLAIVALLAAKYFGLIWMDPMMGVVGAILVTRWSLGLLGQSSSVLLDHQASEHLVSKVHDLMEKEGAVVTDLHIWAIGPEIYSAAVSLSVKETAEVERFKLILSEQSRIVHSTVEVHSDD